MTTLMDVISIMENLTFSSLIGLCTFAGINRACRKPARKREGAYTWAAIVDDGYARCPKCDTLQNKNTKYCEDVHHHVPHFDFKCVTCGFQAYVLPKDA